MANAGAGRVARLGRFLFGFSTRVTRREYAFVGFALTILKVAIDAALMTLWLGGRLSFPLHYLAPLQAFFGTMASQGVVWWQFLLFLWTLPFLWIGVSMTVRRAVDAGGSPWLGILFFVPYLNYALMLILCVLPTRSEARWEPVGKALATALPLGAWFAIVLFVSGVGLGLALLHSVVLRRYGLALFLGVPFATGALAGYLANRDAPRSWGATLGVALVSQVAVGAGLLVVAVEGLVCLLMALPLSLTLAGLGAFLGREIALRRPESPVVAGCLLCLLPAVDAARAPPRPETAVVLTAIEVAAPPEIVWRHVVSFSELPPPREWLFRSGVAYPVRASLTGRGVGAVRHCEFSTGAFVEPITVWDAPRRLAFDVARSPIPMEEWSPYRKVYAAHLDGGFRSRHGEFRLIALPHGRTRLEGRTWYTLDLHPVAYWNLYAQAIVHAIHGRVLEHVRRLAERDAGLTTRVDADERGRSIGRGAGLDPVVRVP